MNLPTGLGRRGVLLGAGAALAVSAAGIAMTRGGSVATGTMTVAEAQRAAAAGDILLVDIRRPDEWSRTGVAAEAVLIDMRRPDFIDALAVARRDAQQPVAVICARGVRSRKITHALAEAGVQAIVDVPEGMLGSGAGPGWIRSGLPVVTWAG